MAKDFEDFADEVLDGRYTSTNKDIYYDLTATYPKNGELSIQQVFDFAKQYTERLTLQMLREYHAWSEAR